MPNTSFIFSSKNFLKRALLLSPLFFQIPGMAAEKFLETHYLALSKREEGEQVRSILKDYFWDYDTRQNTLHIEFTEEGMWHSTSPSSVLKVSDHEHSYALKLYDREDEEGFEKALSALRVACKEELCPPLVYPRSEEKNKNFGTLMNFIPVHRAQLKDLKNKQAFQEFVTRLKKFHQGEEGFPPVRTFDERIKISLEKARQSGAKLGEGFETLPQDLEKALEELEKNSFYTSHHFQEKGLIHKNINYNNLLVEEGTGKIWLGYLDWNEVGEGLVLEELAVLSLMNRFDKEVLHDLVNFYYGEGISYLEALEAFQKKYYLVLASWVWNQALEKALEEKEKGGGEAYPYSRRIPSSPQKRSPGRRKGITFFL